MEALDIPVPWDFEQFCGRLADHTGRSLQVMAVPAMPSGVCGLYVSTADTDYVYTTAGTSPFHREHNALHEIGNLLAGHQGAVGVEDVARLLLPDLDPAFVRTVLGRGCYSSEQECEAEYFATLLLKRSRPGGNSRRPPRPTPRSPVCSDGWRTPGALRGCGVHHRPERPGLRRRPRGAVARP
ncbi:hypothetical protein [Actinomadura viridis]|uniref:IrrE N-terminal-like domain-containing protein n=1 Tax=Actinomadura viridis TaxID=58110 RepID=A0A931DST5_9ACTN|nr:hypothetical protein [Actinomadura viridis]MBG6093206.1 hypothetical protein [Actinomadura viridis]